ncbi:MAG: hypothetical protein KC766_21410, partial [Myxococcales bacterium]|nr:hypothetical protein [Myxococcales bacterium]
MPFHITLPWPDGTLPLATWRRVKSAPSDKLAPSVVRYVIRHGVTPEVTRRWDGVGPLPLRNVVLGDELVGRWRKQLDELGAPVEGRELRLVLSTDEANPVETQVYVPLTTGHSGSLVIEDDLARAMRLHQFEMPGGIAIDLGERRVECRRAWLRVKVPALGFDEAMEVAVRRPGSAGFFRKSGRGPLDEATLLVRGDVPATLALGLPVPRYARGEKGRDGLFLGQAAPDVPWFGVPSTTGTPEASWRVPGDTRALTFKDGALGFALSSDIENSDLRWPRLRIRLERSFGRVRFEAPEGIHLVVTSRTWRGGTAVVGEVGAWLSLRSPADGNVPLLHMQGEDMRCLRAGLVVLGDDAAARSGRVVQWSRVEASKAEISAGR